MYIVEMAVRSSWVAAVYLCRVAAGKILKESPHVVCTDMSLMFLDEGLMRIIFARTASELTRRREDVHKLLPGV